MITLAYIIGAIFLVVFGIGLGFWLVARAIIMTIEGK